MADSKIQVSSRAETIETEKTAAQKKDAEKISARKAQAEKDAKTAREENERKQKEAEAEKQRLKEEEEKRRAEKEAEAEKTAEQLGVLGAAAAAAALKGTSKIKWSDFLKGCVIGLLAGALLCYMVLDGMYRKMMADQNTAESSSVIDDSPITYTVADFETAILGAASEHSELIVMEQPLSINTTITKSGLGNLPIFSKMKDVTYYGTGVYTVDLSKIDNKHIFLDSFNKRVNILIPHTVLQYVNPDLDKTEFQDTERGWLAFGDIRLSAEESNELEKSVRSSMEERLNEEDLLIQADEFAILKTWEIFQPLVTAVSPEYTVEMEFEE